MTMGVRELTKSGFAESRFAEGEFAKCGLSKGLLESLIDEHERTVRPRLDMLWNYYRNPMSPGLNMPGRGVDWNDPGAGRRYRLGQERGLPARLVGAAGRSWGALLRDDRSSWSRKEIVIENDIAWRIHTMVDFMFGKPVVLVSTAEDPALRRRIQRVLDAVFEASGGIGLLQDMALLGHVFGHVDLLVRSATHAGDQLAHSEDHGEGEMRLTPNPLPAPGEGSGSHAALAPRGGGDGEAGPGEAGLGDAEIARRAAELVRIELVEPTRGIPLCSGRDYRRIDAYVLRYRRQTAGVRSQPSAKRAMLAGTGLLRRLLTGQVQGDSTGTSGESGSGASERREVIVTEIISTSWRKVYEQDALDASLPPVVVEEGPSLVSRDRGSGALDSDTGGKGVEAGPPVVHVQNLSQPFAYAGLGEVEALVPLQDELNTRLSDRASRVTLQSFKMLLAKGLGDVEQMTIAPGIVWHTENPDARIESFGGDGASPSEDRHIDEVREAMDKVSGVPPLAGGVVRAKIGNLSSENALRVTLMSLLTKTARKRVTYGRGLAQACALVLEALDLLGVLKTSPAERGVRVEWPDPLPRDEREALDAARIKLELGVPRERVLAELGYTLGEGVEAGVE